MNRFALLAAGLVVLVPQLSLGEEPLPDAKPAPRMQVIPQPYDQASVQRDGKEIARYHFGPTVERPFLFPLIGPAGRSVTRMGHPHDPNGHSHHNSVWIAHHDVDGVNFWTDRRAGRIIHRWVDRYHDADDQAVIAVRNEWVDPEGEAHLVEHRRMTFIPLSEKQWLLLVDLQFAPKGNAATLGKTPFGPIGVRMAKTIGARDGGGLLRNSHGRRGEQAIFRKPARWVDYSGPIAPGKVEGITLMDHPKNARHPNAFHVRDDGWMGASLTLDGPLEIRKDQPLRLRYGLYIHSGMPTVEALNLAFDRFAKRPLPDCTAKRNR